jgi:hypothetical protein
MGEIVRRSRGLVVGLTSHLEIGFAAASDSSPGINTSTGVFTYMYLLNTQSHV